MERDELVRQLAAVAGTLQFQVLNNIDELLAPFVNEGKLDKKALELMVKKPVMQAVTKLKSLSLVTRNPGLENKKGE